MSPWSCDDIVTCDNFEYMVRPWAEAACDDFSPPTFSTPPDTSPG